MSDVATLVPAFKRGLAVPGGFTAAFPNATDEELSESLADAFWYAKLDGFLADVTIDAGITSRDLVDAEQALVLVYATEKVTERLILTMANQAEYQAPGGAVYKTTVAVTILTKILDNATALKERLLVGLSTAQMVGQGGFSMEDSYFINDVADYAPPWHHVGSYGPSGWGGYDS